MRLLANIAGVLAYSVEDTNIAHRNGWQLCTKELCYRHEGISKAGKVDSITSKHHECIRYQHCGLLHSVLEKQNPPSKQQERVRE